MAFELHPRLKAGTVELGRLPGALVLLKTNALFPWLLLVPEVDGQLEDLHQLDPETYAEVSRGIYRVSQFLSSHFRPEKLNVACIGNQVRQMHIHIVGRNTGDPAWPGVVWSHDGKQAYDQSQIDSIVTAWRDFATDDVSPPR